MEKEVVVRWASGDAAVQKHRTEGDFGETVEEEGVALDNATVEETTATTATI